MPTWHPANAWGQWLNLVLLHVLPGVRAAASSGAPAGGSGGSPGAGVQRAPGPAGCSGRAMTLRTAAALQPCAVPRCTVWLAQHAARLRRVPKCNQVQSVCRLVDAMRAAVMLSGHQIEGRHPRCTEDEGGGRAQLRVVCLRASYL